GYNDIANSCRSEEAEAYKLNGKEYEDSFGLNIYEMDLRQYDPAIGRWSVMDPVTHHEFSPYSAFDNNPVYWSDPSGADATTYTLNGKLVGASFTGQDAIDAFLQLIGESSSKVFEAQVQNTYELSTTPDDDGGGGGNGNGGGNGGGKRQKTGFSLLYDTGKSGLSAFAMSDSWNSPWARIAIPDKIRFGFAHSATDYFGFNKGLFFEFITRGHDANLVPYVTFTVGMQAGPKLNADALFNVGIGYFATADMRSLTRGQVAKGLLGWSINLNGGAGDGFGGALGGSYGFQSWNTIVQPTWISGSVGGGYYMGGGVKGGVNYTFPVVESQFKF